MSRIKNPKGTTTIWPDSLWYASAEPLDTLDGLDEYIDTDVLVIGAGYTGLSAALHLTDSINDVVVIDQAQPGWGCSGRNVDKCSAGVFNPFAIIFSKISNGFKVRG